MTRDKLGAIILAGGVGKRTHNKVPKQLMLVGGKPMLVHSLEKIERLANVVDVVIPCAKEAVEKTKYVLDAWGFDEAKYRLVEGGATRQASVYNGLCVLHGCRYVIIHEAARPFVTTDDFERLIEAKEPNAMLGSSIPFTVAEIDDAHLLSGILEREKLVNVQLPQIFEYETLFEAHSKAREAGRTYTEDASLLFDQLGISAEVIEGNEVNIKITYPSDLVTAEAIYRNYIAGGSDE